MTIRIGILGYGNLGRGIECAIRQNDDMELVGIFTRRNPETVTPATNVPVYSADMLPEMKDKIDVLMLCGGSATFQSRHLSTQNTSMLSTASTLTPASLSILQMLMLPPQRTTTSQ
mgnify:CR=1 FL=1